MKKLNNTWLIAALVVLVGAFFVSRFFRAPGLESNLRQQLVQLDTAAITQLRVRPASGGEEISLQREGVNWKVTQGSKSAFADRSAVNAALSSLSALKPLRMVSRKKDKWNDFQVGDGGTQVAVDEADRQESNLHIGKTNFVQNQQGGFGGAYTYVRVGDEDEVYAIDGFLESSFNRTYSDWRNKNFLRVSRDAVSKITFTYPADSSFVLEKKDSVWVVNGQPAAIAPVDTYLGHLAFKNLNNFADDFQPTGAAPVTIKVEARGGPLETIEGWPLPNGQWAFRSTQQPVIFTSEGSSAIQDLLRGKTYFMK
jgi:hypothetical protein